jgi:hypothetical protein
MELRVFNQLYSLQKQYLGNNIPERMVNMKQQLDQIDQQIKDGGDREQLTRQKEILLETFM